MNKWFKIINKANLLAILDFFSNFARKKKNRIILGKNLQNNDSLLTLKITNCY